MLNPTFRNIDARRTIICPGNQEDAKLFAAELLLDIGNTAIQDHGAFFLALSGGSSPKALFQLLATAPYAKRLDWTRVHLFWSDERSVPPTHPESNYHMAMSSGLQSLLIPQEQIHRMQAENAIEENAQLYEQTIHSHLKARPFDLILLGMGEDGHTASLFPHTKALHEESKLVSANYIPEKQTWRMTLTFPCINAATHTIIYALGASKQSMVSTIFSSPDQFDTLPIQKIGTPSYPAIWILDQDALPPNL